MQLRNSVARYTAVMVPATDFRDLKGHARIDARSLAMYRAMAVKQRQSPELLASAHDNLQRWSATAGRSQPYLDAWPELLKLPLAELFVVMVEDSEKMTAMRQAGPFAGVLNEEERMKIFDAYSVRALGGNAAL